MLIHLIVVERLKHPVIFPEKTHLVRIAPQTQKEFDNLEALRRRIQLVRGMGERLLAAGA
jgi:hypothetical protein